MKDFEAVVKLDPMRALVHATAEACTMASKQSGAVYAAALRTVTPPHGTGAKMADTAKKDSIGIRKLKQRIAVDIRGAGDSSYGVTPVRSGNGRWLAFKDGHYTEGGGNFGLVVPKFISFTGADGKKYPVPFVKPADVHKRRVFYTRRGAKRAMPVNPGGVYFVRKTELDRYVAKKQKMAGFTISGWAEGARFFGTGKTIRAGFFGSLGGYGTAGSDTDYLVGADMYDKGRFEYIGYMGNYEVNSMKWSSRMTTTAGKIVGKALGNMERSIIRWYKKKAKEIVG